MDLIEQFREYVLNDTTLYEDSRQTLLDLLDFIVEEMAASTAVHNADWHETETIIRGTVAMLQYTDTTPPSVKIYAEAIQHLLHGWIVAYSEGLDYEDLPPEPLQGGGKIADWIRKLGQKVLEKKKTPEQKRAEKLLWSAPAPPAKDLFLGNHLKGGGHAAGLPAAPRGADYHKLLKAQKRKLAKLRAAAAAAAAADME